MDRSLAAVVRRCQELPGQALFQYPDADDPSVTHKVSSEDVNDYIREAAGTEEFSAKDFRTWAATLLAFRARESAKAAIAMTAEALGDTPTVARNSYIHPAVLEEIDTAATVRGAKAGPASKAPARALATATRRDELALLAFLRRDRRETARAAKAAKAASPSRASATRPKAAARRGVARSGRRAA